MGNPQAQNLLGYFYDHGLGVDRDDAEAVKWFRLAAKLFDAAAKAGHADAPKRLQELAERGVTLANR